MADPKVNSAGQKELNKVEKQFEKFDEQVKSLTLDERDKAPLLEAEPQTKLSSREMKRIDHQYIKPSRTINSREKFNENFRKEYEFAKQYVSCVVENNEIKGERVECWSKPFPGINCEFWQVPVNKPVKIPRYLAEQLARCKYHRLVMDESVKTSEDGDTAFYGSMAVKNTVNRINALPCNDDVTVSMFR